MSKLTNVPVEVKAPSEKQPKSFMDNFEAKTVVQKPKSLQEKENTEGSGECTLDLKRSELPASARLPPCLAFWSYKNPEVIECKGNGKADIERHVNCSCLKTRACPYHHQSLLDARFKR